MTEPIEKWKEEFEKLRNSLPSYKESEYSVMWQGFKLAKRSQPVVDIPPPGKTDHASAAFYACKIFQALTAAGIQYRIKGE